MTPYDDTIGVPDDQDVITEDDFRKIAGLLPVVGPRRSINPGLQCIKRRLQTDHLFAMEIQNPSPDGLIRANLPEEEE